MLCKLHSIARVHAYITTCIYIWMMLMITVAYLILAIKAAKEKLLKLRVI